MSQLVIEGLTVKIATSSDLNDQPWGDFGRAFSGKMRSDRRATHRAFRFTTPELTDAAALALRLTLQSPGALACSGDQIGAESNFHARNVRYVPLETGTDGVVSFELHETDAYSSPLLFSLHGEAPGSYTFTRSHTSGVSGQFLDADGVLTTAAENILRRPWEYSADALLLPDLRSVLIESPAFTNIVSADDLSTWNTNGTPVITGSIDDPAGGTGAYTVEDDTTGGYEYIFKVFTFTGDGVKTVVAIVRDNTFPTGQYQQVRVWDNTAAATRLALQITAWTAGEPTVTAATGTYLGKRYVGNGYWAIYGQTTSMTAANTNWIDVAPGFTTVVGKLDVFRVNAYDSASPPWSILDASETKAAETFYESFPHVPQAMCGMDDFRELEVPDWTTEGGANRRIWAIDTASSAAPRLTLDRQAGSDEYFIRHDTGGTPVTSSVDLNPSWGDRVQLFWWLFADGSVLIAGRKQALGSSTWSSITTGTQSGALALASAWSDERIYFGSVGATGRGSQLYYASVIVRDSGYDTDELLDFASARLHRKVA